MKTCTKCGIEKPKSEFHKHKDYKDSLQSNCKGCSNLRANKYYKTPKGKESTRRVRLKRTYGITVEQYNIMLEAQDYVCAICGTDKPGGSGRFHIDHCHSTGKVRGLLCIRCNTKVGVIEDKEFNKLAIKYLGE
jgi:hypothetical protein